MFSLNSRWRFIAAYTIVFAVLALVAFVPFILTGRTFVWDSDGLTQHVKALGYYGMWLRDIGESLFSGTGFEAPTFAFSLGYGSDIIDTLNYYAVGDPLNLLAALVPLESTPMLYSALVIVRLYLAGLAFSLFVRYTFKAPYQGVLIGALVFAFCGFSLYAGVRHPFFLNPLIYLPFVLFGVEKILRERKHVWFALAIALCGLSNFYFFYMIFLLMAVYIIVRLVALHRRDGIKGIKSALGDFVHLVVAGIVGLLVSCVLFLPVVLYFLQDSRAEVEHMLPLFYSAKYYSQFFMDLATMGDPGKWTFVSTGIIGIMGIVSLFSERRSNTQLKVLLVIGFVFLCIPVFGYALNGFSYLANRWSWAFCLIIACVVAVRWESIICMPKRRAIGMIVAVAIYLGASLLIGWPYLPHKGYVLVSGIWLVSAAVIVATSAINASRKTVASARVVKVMVALAVFGGISMNALALYMPIGGNYVGSFMTAEELPEIFDTEAHAVRNAAGDGDGFYRYAAQRPVAQRNAGLLAGVSSTTNYWSLVNNSAKEFFFRLGITGSDNSGFCWYDLNGQTMLEELAGIRYYAAPEGCLAPYDYSQEPIATGTVMNIRKDEPYPYGVFENLVPLPFGYTYSKTVSQADFEDMQPRERRETLMQTCLVEVEPNADLDGIPVAGRDSISTTSYLLDYALELGEGIKEKGNKSKDAKSYKADKGSSITILVDDAPANVEPSIQFTGFVLGTSESSAEIDARFNFVDGTSSSCVLSVANPSDAGYEPWRWHTVSPGYSEAALESVTLTFPRKGTYSWKKLGVIAQPMDNYEGYVAGLAQDVLEDVDLHYLSSETAATNRVTGTISLDEPKVLCTQIPYSAGWSVKVDGKDAEVLKTNIMFAGVALGAGTHTIEFAYETPGLFAGSLLTVLGLVLLVLLGIYDRRSGKKRASDGPEDSGLAGDKQPYVGSHLAK